MQKKKKLSRRITTRNSRCAQSLSNRWKENWNVEKIISTIWGEMAMKGFEFEL